MAGPLARVTRFPVPRGRDVDLEIYPGDVIRLVGPNGSGKTSFLRSLAGLDAPVRPRGIRTSQAGMAMQDARDSLIGLTVAGEFRLRHIPVTGDLPPHHREVRTLSSGEARRVALAVAAHAPLLLLDEPHEGLDASGIAQLRTLIDVHRRNGAVVIADHGNRFADVATRTLQLGNDARRTWPRFAAPTGTTRNIDGTERGPGLHAITGPNGCGKTTKLRRIWKQHGGTFLPAPGRDALHHDTVQRSLEGRDAEVVRRLVPEALLGRHPLHLSGGEAQRVALASILGQSADVICLDEPEAHLDGAGHDALRHALQHRIAQGACIVVATHDRSLIAAANSVSEP